MTDINKPQGEENNEQIVSKTGDVVSAFENRVAHTLEDCKYPDHKGYAALWTKYGNNERYKDFFSKLKIEGIDIIIDNKKFALLTAEHNGVDIFSGDFEDEEGEKGITELTYMSGEAAMKQAKKQNKKLFKTGREADEFINQFPGENTREKIFSFVSLFNLQKSGSLSGWKEKQWEHVNSVGYAILSGLHDNSDDVREVNWTDNFAIMFWRDKSYLEPIVVFEDC